MKKTKNQEIIIDCFKCRNQADCCRFGAWIDLEEAKKILSLGIKGDFFHLELDKDDFLILLHKQTRVFQSKDVTEATKKATLRSINKDSDIHRCLEDLHPRGLFYKLLEQVKKHPKTNIRVRVHANHDYSGFGKAFERKFKWNEKNKQFEPLK